MLPHNPAFVSLLTLVMPFLTTSELDDFLVQFTGTRGRHRSLQGTPSVDTSSFFDGITDSIAPPASNGWIDEQLWRAFDSGIGKPGARGEVGSVKIRYVTVRGSGTRGGVILSPGHGEPIEKYAEQIWNLQQAGFSPIYGLDHRGQGRSTRLLDDHFKSHVEAATDFTADFRAFVSLADAEMSARGEGGGKRFLHCHSMGCAIAFSYLIEEYYAQRANVFNAVAANAPLIKPVTDPFPYSVAVLIGEAMKAVGLGEAYPPTKGKSFDELYRYDEARPDRLNLHYGANCHAKRDQSYEAGHTGLCLGDVTGNFAAEFFGMYSTFEAFSRGKLSVPILLQQAKDVDGNDGVVVNAPQESFCSSAVDSCTLSKYPNSAHNIWFERDSVRTAALSEVYTFYDSKAAAKQAQNSLPPMCSGWWFWCAGEHCDCIWSCSHPAASC